MFICYTRDQATCIFAAGVVYIREVDRTCVIEICKVTRTKFAIEINHGSDKRPLLRVLETESVSR